MFPCLTEVVRQTAGITGPKLRKGLQGSAASRHLKIVQVPIRSADLCLATADRGRPYNVDRLELRMGDFIERGRPFRAVGNIAKAGPRGESICHGDLEPSGV